MPSSTSPHSFSSEPPHLPPRRYALLSSFAPLLLVPVVLVVHGYHPFAGDAGIYIAGIRHILHPTLYPLNAVFIAAFTQFSLFAWIIAALVRLLHLPLPWILIAAYLISVWLFLAAVRSLAARFFASESARWSAVLLAAACFTLPVAGTALFLMDPYLTARSFSTPLCLFAVAASMDRAWLRASLLLLLAAALHPLMAAYAIAFVLLYAAVSANRPRVALGFCLAALTSAAIAFAASRHAPIVPAYREAVSLAPRSFLFLARWRWYEILGLVLPLLLLFIALRRCRPASPVRPLCVACLLLGATSVLVAALFVSPEGPYLLVPLQILRAFHLVYAIGAVLLGGILSPLIARSQTAGALLFLPLFAGMFAAGNAAWPACNRIEWPWLSPANPYQQVFLWIRIHTPANAVFAFNPQLVYLPDEDEQGFRAIAERDHLADDKDAGIVAVLPRLAILWARQRNAEFPIDRMTDAQRLSVLTPLGATWLLLPPAAQTAFRCPWRNQVVQVCQLARAGDSPSPQKETAQEFP